MFVQVDKNAAEWSNGDVHVHLEGLIVGSFLHRTVSHSICNVYTSVLELIYIDTKFPLHPLWTLPCYSVGEGRVLVQHEVQFELTYS